MTVQVAIAPASCLKARRETWVALLLAMIPCLGFLEIQIVGRLFVPEMIMALALFGAVLLRRVRLVRGAVVFFVMGALWLVAQILTDVVRHTPFEDYARGWAKIGMFLLLLGFMQVFLRRHQRRRLMFAVGIAVGGMLSYWLNPSIYAQGDSTDNFWKFGVGGPLTMMIVLLASKTAENRRVAFSIGLMLGAALLNILLGFRSLGGAVFCAMLCQIAQLALGRGGRASPAVHRHRVVLGICAIVGGVAISAAAYESLIAYAWTDYDMLEKTESQKGDFGQILGGRMEILASARAIGDSPIIGHGSWAKDASYLDYLDELRDYGYEVALVTSSEEDQIPSHSYLFGAWVESGIMGAAFWCFAFVQVCRLLLSIFRRDAVPLTPFECFVCFGLGWDILFSPFGAQGRLIAAFDLTVAISALARMNARRNTV